MKSSILKRSIINDGHKTSVSLEDAFWSDPKEIAYNNERRFRNWSRKSTEHASTVISPPHSAYWYSNISARMGKMVHSCLASRRLNQVGISNHASIVHPRCLHEHSQT
jgi:hypothetical protein